MKKKTTTVRNNDFRDLLSNYIENSRKEECEEIRAKKKKFFSYLPYIMDKQNKSELINLYQIYEDYGCPRYSSPKRILSYRTGKELIQYEIENNDMQIEKVIKFNGKTVYGNYSLALHYLRSIDAYNSYLFIDLLMHAEPNILEKYLRLSR